MLYWKTHGGGRLRTQLNRVRATNEGTSSLEMRDKINFFFHFHLYISLPTSVVEASANNGMFRIYPRRATSLIRGHLLSNLTADLRPRLKRQSDREY